MIEQPDGESLSSNEDPFVFMKPLKSEVKSVKGALSTKRERPEKRESQKNERQRRGVQNSPQAVKSSQEALSPFASR